MSGIAHDADAVEYEPADEFGRDDQGIQPQREVQARAQVFKRGKGSHDRSVAWSSGHSKRWRNDG